MTSGADESRSSGARALLNDDADTVVVDVAGLLDSSTLGTSTAREMQRAVPEALIARTLQRAGVQPSSAADHVGPASDWPRDDGPKAAAITSSERIGADLTLPPRPASRELRTMHTKLVGDLRELCNEQGATLQRLAARPALVSLGRMWRQAGSSDAEDDIVATRQLLRRAIDDLRAKERDLLLAQFAFTYQHGSREQREAAYLEDVRRSRSKGSESSFERWSRVGIGQLAERMINRATGAGTAVDDRDSSASPEPFSVESTHERYRFREGRIIKDVLVDVTVRSLLPGEHMFLAHRIYYTDLRDGVLQTVPERGCTLTTSQYCEYGRMFCLLRLDKSLSVGELFSFSYHIRVDSDVPAASRIMHTSDHNASRYLLDIEFASDATPSKIWAFSHLSHSAAYLSKHRRHLERPHDGSRYVREAWNGLVKGLTYGIEWEW